MQILTQELIDVTSYFDTEDPYLTLNIAMKDMEKIENTTPDISKCKRPGPPPHQATFTSTPYCSRKCTCEGRKQRKEMRQKIKNWMVERNILEKERRSQEEAAKKDSGIHSPDDSDKENRL